MPHDAQQLLEISRRVRWDFPSSSGRPLRGPAGRGDLDRAGASLDAADAIFRDNGIDPATDDRVELDWLRDQLTCAAT